MNENFIVMMGLSFALIVFYLILQIFTFTLYGMDKSKARNNKRRISEKTLLTFSFFAPFGALLGMLIFRHKTKKAYFYVICLIAAFLHFILLFNF